MNRVYKSGAQKRNEIAVTKSQIPVATALLNMPRAATILPKCDQNKFYDRSSSSTYFVFLVSSAIWTEASKPVSVPVVKRLRNIQ